MKILITGSKGQLGQSIKKIEDDYPQLDIVYTDIEELDILSRDQVKTFINNLHPNFLINCAAYTAVDKAEDNQVSAASLNSIAPGLLAEIMNQIDGKTIHISTDYVFDGKKGRDYLENDKPTACTVYGKTKADGEKNVLKYPGTYVIRTSWLYSEFGNNFFKTMHRLLNERDEIKVVNDQIGTPTYATDLARMLLSFVDLTNKKKIEEGIYHFSNDGIVSWYDFAKEIALRLNSSCIIHPIPTSEFPLPAERPPYSVMNKEKIKKLGLFVPEWKESLDICIANYN